MLSRNILILVFFNVISLQMTFSQTFEWVSKVKMDTILNVGNYHRLIQLCSPEDDSLIVTGKAII